MPCLLRLALWAVTASVWCAQASANYCPYTPRMCVCQGIPGQMMMLNCTGYSLNETILTDEINTLLFNDSSGLEVLRISSTPLTEIPSSVCGLRNLSELWLDHNRLARLPDNCFNNMTSLKKLIVNHNHITELQNGIFDGMISLMHLILSSNRIDSIGLRVFSGESNLVKLHYISLENNRLESLEPWPFILGLHGSQQMKVAVNIHNNSISTFTNYIGWYFNCTPRSYVKLDIRRNKLRHLNDILVGWKIASVGELFCPPQSGTMDPGLEIDVSYGQEYRCDCQDMAFRQYEFRNLSLTSFVFMERLKCRNPAQLSQKLAMQVPLPELVCELEDGCPSGCHCLYRAFNNTLHVDCSNTQLTRLPSDLPPLHHNAKYKLDFSGNNLRRRLEHRWYFVSTAILDVSNCQIDDIDMNMWKDFTNIHLVDLRENKLSSLRRSVEQVNLSTTHLSLSNNPWDCHCKNQWMTGCLKSLSSAGLLTKGGDVVCASPSRLRGRSIPHSGDDEFCVDPAATMLKISIPSTLGPVIVFIIIGFVGYRMRVTVFRRWKFHPFDRDECVGEDMEYDVFLCCSSEDHGTHGLDLLRSMESSGYRVCYHLRDFLPGEFITDNMCEAVVRSKRTVCLLSKNFLKSAYCMTEFDIAYNHNVAVKRKKRLIVLMMLDSPIDHYVNVSHMATLSQYLNQYTYIDCRKSGWFDKLLYALPLRGLLQGSDESGDTVQLF